LTPSNYSRGKSPANPFRCAATRRTGQPKCNAEFCQCRTTPAASMVSMFTFFLFLSSAYISLHEKSSGSAKYFKNGRSPGRAGKNRPNPCQNLGDFQQNLVIFGRCKGLVPTFRQEGEFLKYGSFLDSYLCSRKRGYEKSVIHKQKRRQRDAQTYGREEHEFLKYGSPLCSYLCSRKRGY
jgi:hypothetical protein